MCIQRVLGRDECFDTIEELSQVVRDRRYMFLIIIIIIITILLLLLSFIIIRDGGLAMQYYKELVEILIAHWHK